MFLRRRPHNWTPVSSIKMSWKCFGGAGTDRMLILENVWNKEAGALAGHCRITGISKNGVQVKADSSVAAGELRLRARQLAASLNKYFQKPWIKSIVIASEV